MRNSGSSWASCRCPPCAPSWPTRTGRSALCRPRAPTADCYSARISRYLLRPRGYLHAPLVALPFGTAYGLLIGLRAPPVEPPDAVALLWVKSGSDLSGHLTLRYQPLYLLPGVRAVGIVPDRFPYKELPPNLLPFGSGQPIALEDAFHAPDGDALRTHHTEDTFHDGHSLVVYLVAVPGGVVTVAIVRALGGDDLTLSGLPELPSAALLGDLETLVAGNLVQYAGRQLSL